MTDPPVEVCTTCGAGPVQKVLFPVAVHFKGAGFYSTDYGRGNRKPGAKEGDGAGEKTAAEKPAGDKRAGEKKASTDAGS